MANEVIFSLMNIAGICSRITYEDNTEKRMLADNIFERDNNGPG